MGGFKKTMAFQPRVIKQRLGGLRGFWLFLSLVSPRSGLGNLYAAEEPRVLWRGHLDHQAEVRRLLHLGLG